MSHPYKFLKAIISIPVAVLAIYIAVLWITYIDKTIVSGSKYGFTIGANKEKVYEKILAQQETYPDLHFYIRTGTRSGDNIEAPVSSVQLEKLANVESWDLQYDGKHEYFNVLKLKFAKNSLIEIHRHRKYFELP